MSRRKDIERAVAGNPHRNNGARETLVLRCKKCGMTVSEAFVERHINECQGGKAECGKCHKWIEASEFIRHWRECGGKDN